MEKLYDITDKFRQVLITSNILGILANIYITVLLIYAEGYEILWSPIIGSLLLFIISILLKKNKINVKLSFFLTSYIVVIEVVIHSYFLGLNCGFFYYIFIMPLLFLLYSHWKISTTILFNSSMFLVAIFLNLILNDEPSILGLPLETQLIIGKINLGLNAVVILIIMIYFSSLNNKKEIALINAYSNLESQNTEIVRQHIHLQTLIKEVHHRVKNNLQIISSLLSLQKQNVNDSDVAEVLNESRRRVDAIAMIHQKLHQNDKADQVDFKSYLQDLLDTQKILNPGLRTILISDQAIINLDLAVPLGLIVSELFTNSIKHAYHNIDSPKLLVELTNNSNQFQLVVKDNGIGLPDNFNLKTPTSLGSEIVALLIDQIDAKISYENNKGAQFTIEFNHQLN